MKDDIKVKVYLSNDGQLHLWVAYREKWFKGYFFIPSIKLWMTSTDTPQSLNMKCLGEL